GEVVGFSGGENGALFGAGAVFGGGDEVGEDVVADAGGAADFDAEEGAGFEGGFGGGLRGGEAADAHVGVGGAGGEDDFGFGFDALVKGQRGSKFVGVVSPVVGAPEGAADFAFGGAVGEVGVGGVAEVVVAGGFGGGVGGAVAVLVPVGVGVE